MYNILHHYFGYLLFWAVYMVPVKKISIRIPLLFMVFQMASICSLARIAPVNRSVLSQIHVMFEYDDVFGADYYELDIFRIVQNEKTTGTEKVFSKRLSDISILVNNGLHFGNEYRWQYRAFKKQKSVFTSQWYRFSILQSPQVNEQVFRTEVTCARCPGNDIIFLDHSAMAINRKGKPVWFLPVNTDSLSKWVIRDLELTPGGTITHLDIYGAYEKDLYGRILRRLPDNGTVSGGTREDYHHDLKKMDDGSYWVCGSAYKPGQEPATASAATSIRYNTLIHYNANGTIRSSWNELHSLEHDSLFKQFRKNTSGGHLNGFALTPDRKKAFLSFKNLSDVFLLNIGTGFFETSIKQSNPAASLSFQQQHGPFLTANNELLIYNNNILDKEGDDSPRHPSVLIFRYNEKTGTISPVWEYELRSDKYPEGIMGKEGYVSETDNGNLLICAGGVNYAAEVNRNREKIWECFFYKRTGKDTAWKPYANYRCQRASSLYPLYYTVRYAGKKDNQYLFELSNAGSEPGTFQLIFSKPGTQATIRSLSKHLVPGEKQVFYVPVNRKENKEIRCTISPAHLTGEAKEYRFKMLH